MTAPRTRTDARTETTTKLVKLSALHPAPWNPRTISDQRFKQLCAALKADPDFLWDRPILARAENGEIYAGNMRYRAAEYLASHDKTWKFQDEVPARLEDVSEQLSQERALKDNNQFGDWREDDLGQLIARLETQGAEIMLLGFDDNYIKKLLQAATHPINPDTPPEAEDEAKIDELIQRYGTASGQLWELGNHRLFIGDSANKENVDSLFARTEHAILLVTDPPYNVGLRYQNDQTNDNMTREEYEDWTARWFKLWRDQSARQIVTPGSIATVGFFLSHPDCFHVYHVAPWIKPNATVQGKIAHFWCWEAILFCADPTANPKNKTGGFGKKRSGDLFEYPITNQNMPDKQRTPGKDRNDPLTDYHPCPKPYELWKDFLTHYSEPGDVIGDAFSGSGTTLVAAEQLNRQARVMEISPGYAAVAIERWVQYTRQTPRLLTIS